MHILVNNAGITRDNLLFKLTEDDWDSVMNVHLKGAFLMSKAVQKTFVDQKYGKILGLSSVSANGNRGQANYSAAKAGVQGFTRTLALELGKFGVNVNAIAPGFIATEMTDDTARRLGRGGRGVPQDERRGQPGQAGGPPRGHRRRCRVPVQRRGVVHHRPDAVRRRWRQDLSLEHTELLVNMRGPCRNRRARFVMLARMSSPLLRDPARARPLSPRRFALSLTLAACGGGDDKSSSGDSRTPSRSRAAPSWRRSGR